VPRVGLQVSPPRRSYLLERSRDGGKVLPPVHDAVAVAVDLRAQRLACRRKKRNHLGTAVAVAVDEPLQTAVRAVERLVGTLLDQLQMSPRTGRFARGQGEAGAGERQHPHKDQVTPIRGALTGTNKRAY